MKSLLFLCATFFWTSLISFAYGAGPCNIYIHGRDAKLGSWDNLPHYINWNSSLELENAAEDLAPKLVAEISKCKKAPIFLRTYDYSSAVVYYILGLGRRYADLYPQHNFVRIYQATIAVYSFGGAFSGTPLMDYVCASGKSKAITKLVGEKCILSMTTAEIYHPSSIINSPGVPIYLVFGTHDREYGEEVAELLRGSGLTWEERYQNKESSRSDGVVPLASAMACENEVAITDVEGECNKINNDYFIDFFRSDEHSHSDLVRDRELLRGVYDEN
ncbi:MAG: hypothetical protein A2504_08845 [Bdellovibrionales bacterium RIFOXYD12_FULL_39_22]|nr:MAG: hypothetical protein A2385_13360 [Bdellovibrionales bacterium RIFOXYB1_FULL_39_21]OFZ40922.1 MAG: hypothetical protein A2485_16385 [Bdellovibrionales bacterium RIFOXYC12_FULL_39_17]OFZ44734.1 MAG: hypothetical protein A2404_10735 [Bdellovibrionales bacterium RIFOXYC1_FULL_39_130]OFZ74185.1 MAG: hypothetical protein A2560_03400 [Bdellovibrionales bacterium RIFOXYD1_FULL_39_84]OFZ92065.1 MAG: hypothetical protein A2504_08845 [Bdellovibrionales bacterium RIFOXYD12_FULL_39_22]HLE10616.1 hy